MCLAVSGVSQWTMNSRNYGERGVKILRIEFFNEVWRKQQDCQQASWVVDITDTDTCLQVNSAVDNRHLELSTMFFREQRLPEFEFGCQQAPWAVGRVLPLGEPELVSEFVSDPNSESWFPFLLGIHAYIKRDIVPCYWILYLIDLIRSLSFSARRT